MNELDKVADAMAENEKEEIASFSKVIASLKNEDKTINMYDFELYFLPYIIGEIARTDENKAVYISNFLRVTESHHIGIAVVNGENEVVFKLPPLITDSDVSELSNIAFNRVMKQVRAYSDSNPWKADAIMKNVTNEVISKMKVDDSKGYLEDLIKIYKTYPDRVNKVILRDGELIIKDNKQQTTQEDEEELFDY